MVVGVSLHVQYLSRLLLYMFQVFFPSLRVLATYHVHALKAETTGFMVAGCAALSELGMGSRGLAWVGRWLLVVRGCSVDTIEVLLKGVELLGWCGMGTVLQSRCDARRGVDDHSKP